MGIFILIGVFVYNYIDYEEDYGRIMHFGKNKKLPIHRWYPFVEGYSKEFIESIINEQKNKPKLCLDPFSGSGTTATELQSMGIDCISFEVNPLMYKLSRVKISSNKYSIDIIKEDIIKLKSEIYNNNVEPILNLQVFKTLVENEEKKKWNLNKKIYFAVQKIKKAISKIENILYQDLYTIALANILIDVSNLYRNGKCLSYKKNWKDNQITEEDVYNSFFNIINDVFIVDISILHDNSNNSVVDNSEKIYLGDCRDLISKYIEDESIDIVITSPPYLNSRDYTDSYMLELKTLGFVSTHKDIKELRKHTLRSHVQLKWGVDESKQNPLLKSILDELEEKTKNEQMWNNGIENMIIAYFEDIEKILSDLFKKLKNNGIVYYNVSNSAYYNVLINTLEITANIAEVIGFTIVEIRKARYIKCSPQQQKTIGKLLEGIIVMKKEVNNE